MKKRMIILTLAAGLLLSLSASGGPALAQSVPETREQINLSFAPVVKQTAPAVVNIYAKVVVQTRRRAFASPLFDDPFFKRFFGENFGGFGGLGKPRQRVQNSLGSGVILSDDGIVVTNHHVIKNAKEIRVVLADKREFDGEILLSDERTDIAVVRLVDFKGALPTAALGDSDDVEVGDLVLAIGNPFGVGQTVTSGIISGLARTSVGITDFQSFIQTDAAINPGNSGGALVATDGSVIGINTAIFSKSGGSMGIGFAVPSNMVRAIVDSARAGKPLVRPWLGFGGRDVDADMAEALGMATPRGVIVEHIHPRGPAADAGMKVGDIVLSADGRPIEDAEALRFRAATRGVGESLSLAALRNGRDVRLDLRLIGPPEDPPRDPFEVRANVPLGGATLINMSPAVATEFGIPTDTTGVFVLTVANRSPAAKLGFRPGDKLLEVSGVKVEDTALARRIVAEPPANWRISIERQGKTLSVDVR